MKRASRLILVCCALLASTLGFHATCWLASRRPSLLQSHGPVVRGRAQRQQLRTLSLETSAIQIDLEPEEPKDPKDLEERKQIVQLLSKWRANDAEAWGCLALTAALYAVALFTLHMTSGHWASIIFLALGLVRCFVVFHDAAHLSFFEEPNKNRTLADILQFFVSYSHENWSSVHNPHHAHFGDSTVWDPSLTIWLSEKELEEAPWYLKLGHRLFRDPLVFFPLASVFVFFLNKPHVHGLQRIVVPALVWATLGPQTAFSYLIASWLAGMVGVIFFHLQHSCNAPYRVKDDKERSSLDAALLGSTRLPVAWPLSIFTFGIEYHHIHHFDVRVPGYRLPRCDAEGEALGLWKRVNNIGPLRAFKSLFHSQFEGSIKSEQEGHQPRFKSFWPYSALGLQDV